MRIIQIKKAGKWVETMTVDDGKANKIVRTLNKEGHTARSVKAKTATPERATKKTAVKFDKMTTPAAWPKSMSARPSRMRTEPVIVEAMPDVTLLDINDIVEYPTIEQITKAVKAVAKANELSAAQLATMLKIEGAGRMDDPKRGELKLHAATFRALVNRKFVTEADVNGNMSVHLTIAGRRALLAAVAKVIAPNAERRELVAA